MGGRLEFVVCMEKKDDASERIREREGSEERENWGLKSVSQRLNK